MQEIKPERLRRAAVWLIVGFVVTIILMLAVYDVVALPGCESCHDKAEFKTATLASPHAQVDCRSCHVPADVFGRIGFASHQLFGMYIPLAKGTERDASLVPDARCTVCHQGLNGGPVSRNGLRIPHSSCAAGAQCGDCHSSVAHGDATSWVRTYSMDACLACHIPEKNTSCDLCHEGRLASGRITSGSFAITHGPQWQSTHGMGDSTTCLVCHTQDDCVSCHGAGLPHDLDFMGRHGTYSVDANAKCSGCHDQAAFCDACHRTPMPHSADFTKTHASEAEADRPLCDSCHAESDCTTCHEKHVHPGGAIGSTSGGGS